MGYLGTFQKNSADKFLQPILYDDVLLDSELISTCTLAAEDLDGAVVTATILSATNATRVSGTATGGSTTTLIDTAKNFSAVGIIPGMNFHNTTKKWTATVTDITSTTNAYDTVHFETAASAAAASDAYAFFIASASLKAGAAGTSYKITWTMTSSLARVFIDSVVMEVRDA